MAEKTENLDGAAIPLPGTLSDLDILTTDYPDPEWIIPNLLPEGLTILCGKPKAGKSTFSLDLGVSVAKKENIFGLFEVQKRDVLCLALEDTARRLKKRLASRLNGSEPSDRLHFAFEWSQIDSGGIEDLDKWLEEHVDTKLVIIDTLGRFRGTKRSGWTLYDAEYEELSRLKKVADKHHVAILLLHHLRKTNGTDVLDMVSGSIGITAAADTIIIMKKGKGQVDAELFFTGRDIEDTGLALQFDEQDKSFAIMGQADECNMSPERREVLDFLKDVNEAVQLKDIAKALNKKDTTVRKLLSGLIENGFVEQPGYGKYQIKGKTGESGASGETGEGDTN